MSILFEDLNAEQPQSAVAPANTRTVADNQNSREIMISTLPELSLVTRNAAAGLPVSIVSFSRLVVPLDSPAVRRRRDEPVAGGGRPAYDPSIRAV
jgi:hypothetical protein